MKVNIVVCGQLKEHVIKSFHLKVRNRKCLYLHKKILLQLTIFQSYLYCASCQVFSCKVQGVEANGNQLFAN